MLWYGRPAYYQKPEEIEFFKYVPTTWDQTIHLKGEIGQYIIVGRKKGNKWFLGTAVNDQELQTEVALDFLDKGKQYQASIYEDDGKGGIKKTMRTVDHNTKLIQKISPKGGEAIMIE
jgi:alpha-glucosidase